MVNLYGYTSSQVVGQVAGIGGIALGVFLLLFREIIRIKIFPQLTKAHAYSTIRLILLLVWSVALAGIGAWLWVETSRSHPQPSQNTRIEEGELRARVEELERDVPSFKEDWKKEAWAKAEATSDPREICFFIVEYPSDPLALLAAFRITKLATATVVKALEVDGSSKSIATMTSDEIYRTVRNLCEKAPFSLAAPTEKSSQNPGLNRTAPLRGATG
jgi:hypothetical protein